MKSVFIKIFSFIVFLQLVVINCSWADPSNELWLSQIREDKKVKLHFFWSKTCPHCRKAKPFIENLATSHDWIELGSYEISENKENAEFFLSLSESIGSHDFGVPAFAFCGQMVVGYFNDETTGAQLQN